MRQKYIFFFKSCLRFCHFGVRNLTADYSLTQHTDRFAQHRARNLEQRKEALKKRLICSFSKKSHYRDTLQGWGIGLHGAPTQGLARADRAGLRLGNDRQESREQGLPSEAQEGSCPSLPGQKGRINPHQRGFLQEIASMKTHQQLTCTDKCIESA